MPHPAFFSIKNFAQFQHYKKRNPPWIKLYYNILNDDGFLALNEVDQGRLIKLFLLASRTNNLIRNNPSYLKKILRLEHQPDIITLFHSGFLVPMNADGTLALLEEVSTRNVKQSSSTISSNGHHPWESYEITDAIREWCRTKELPDPTYHLEAFQIHFCKTGGKTNGHAVKNWDAAFKQWMLRTRQFKGEPGIER